MQCAWLVALDGGQVSMYIYVGIELQVFGSYRVIMFVEGKGEAVGGVVDASRVRVWCESRTQNWNWSSNTATPSQRESL